MLLEESDLEKKQLEREIRKVMILTVMRIILIMIMFMMKMIVVVVRWFL
jgi:hypothetical protein